MLQISIFSCCNVCSLCCGVRIMALRHFVLPATDVSFLRIFLQHSVWCRYSLKMNEHVKSNRIWPMQIVRLASLLRRRTSESWNGCDAYNVPESEFSHAFSLISPHFLHHISTLRATMNELNTLSPTGWYTDVAPLTCR